MADRIKLAHDKGCDAIDPDNVDGFQASGAGGTGLRKPDAVNFMRFISESATKFGMATGLKNAMDILKEIRPYVHFAVNEQCANKKECQQYKDFKKPVFHIEYPRSDIELKRSGGLPATTRGRYCVDNDRLISNFFHTVIKVKALDGIVQYCDGKYYKTPTKNAKGGRSRDSWVNSMEDDPDMPLKSWQNDPAMISWQLKLAESDGYPFNKGSGSDAFISDADLLKSYDWGQAATEEAVPVSQPEPVEEQSPSEV